MWRASVATAFFSLRERVSSCILNIIYCVLRQYIFLCKRLERMYWSIDDSFCFGLFICFLPSDRMVGCILFRGVPHFKLSSQPVNCNIACNIIYTKYYVHIRCMHISWDKRILFTISAFPVNRWRKSPKLSLDRVPVIAAFETGVRKHNETTVIVLRVLASLSFH